MPRGKDLDPQLRAKIYALADISWPFPRIACEYELSRNTVNYTVRMAAQREGNKSLLCSGAPCIYDDEDVRDAPVAESPNPMPSPDTWSKPEHPPIHIRRPCMVVIHKSCITH
jgi:hypothetical protein